MKRILNFIGGQFRPPCSGRYLPDVNPATGQVIAETAESGPEDVDAAVAAASRAFESWRRTPAEERSQLLIRVAELIEKGSDAHLLREMMTFVVNRMMDLDVETA